MAVVVAVAVLVAVAVAVAVAVVVAVAVAVAVAVVVAVAVRWLRLWLWLWVWLWLWRWLWLWLCLWLWLRLWLWLQTRRRKWLHSQTCKCRFFCTRIYCYRPNSGSIGPNIYCLIDLTPEIFFRLAEFNTSVNSVAQCTKGRKEGSASAYPQAC